MFVAVCACNRWRGKPHKEATGAADEGDAHIIRGDEHNRVLAAMHRGRTTLKSEYKWYVEQSENPLNSEKEREVWAKLAQDLYSRVHPPASEDQGELW